MAQLDDVPQGQPARQLGTPMPKEELDNAIRDLIETAEDFVEEVGYDRERNWRYWDGECDVKPAPDRTDIVSMDVYEIVEGAVPHIMEALMGFDSPVEFRAKSKKPQDHALAAQLTQTCRYIFENQGGWEATADWVRDSLIAKTGIWKVFVAEDEELRAPEEHEGMAPDEATLFAAREGREILAYDDTSSPGSVSILSRDRDRTWTYHVEAIPPEQFLINRDAYTADDARIVGQRSTLTVGDLVDMGIPYEKAISVRTVSKDDADTVIEQQARDPLSTRTAEDAITPDPASWPVQVFDLWVRVDADGDGYAERLHVIAGGEELTKILHIEPADDQPYVVASPIRRPHRVIGKALADVLIDLQDQSTFLSRQMIDNVTWHNNPRLGYVEGLVNPQDLDDNKFAGKVRMRALDAITPIEIPFVADKTLLILQHFDERRRMRTGMTEETEGVNAKALQSSTEYGVRAIMGRSQMQIMMMIRTLAETGMKTMFAKLAKLIMTNPQAPAGYEDTKGLYTEFERPPKLPPMNLCVTVGLSADQREDRIAALGQVINKQEQILLNLGPQNPFCAPEHLSHAYADFINISPLDNADRYFNPPEVTKQLAQQQAQQQKPDPEMQKLKAEMELKKAELQMEMQMKQAQLQQDAQLSQQEAQMDAQTDLAKAQMQAQIDMIIAKIEAGIELTKAEEELRLKAVELAAEVRLEKYKIDKKVEADSRLRSPAN